MAWTFHRPIAMTVQHLEGGIVSDILVRNGDRVREGDVLIRLDETASRANLGVITARLNELYTQKARLESEQAGAPRLPRKVIRPPRQYLLSIRK